MAKVIVLLADGFEEIEAVTVIDILRRAEVEVCVAGISEGDITGAHDLIIKPDAFIGDVFENDFDMVVLPGGTDGAANINESDYADKLIRRMAEQEKYVTAICAAPYVLVEKGVLEGKMATSYPSFQEKVEYGCEYQNAIVVVDENVVTSRGPGTAAEFAFTLVELLIEEDTAEELRQGMLFND